MPDKKMLRENVKKLMMGGKSVNEAVAIARSIQKEERRKDAEARHKPSKSSYKA